MGKTDVSIRENNYSMAGREGTVPVPDQPSIPDPVDETYV